MGILDIILLLCFVPAIVQGISKGFILQAISMISIVVGVWMASRFSAMAAEWICSRIHMETGMVQIVAFVVIVILTIMLLYWLGVLLTRVIKIVTLGWINSLLGILFAILNTMLVLGLLIMCFESINGALHLVDQAKLSDANVYCAIRSLAQKVFPYIKTMLANV